MSSLVSPLAGLRSIIVGAGPSGLLLAHRLLDAGASVSILERRLDPRKRDALEGRAYALGLGCRGRTAIRSVDDELWQSIAAKGFPSDRFTLNLGNLKIDLRTPDDSNSEPSILIYQSDLCASMLEELTKRHDPPRLSLTFGARVISCDPLKGAVTYMLDGKVQHSSVDLVAGCDGINSVIREGISTASLAFAGTVKSIPGKLKVIRLEAMPSCLVKDAVNVVPGKPISAFLEPTRSGACALLTWQESAAECDPADITDVDEAAEILARSLPLLQDCCNVTDAGQQFVNQGVSVAATVRCNCYHLSRAVLLGDAAHSTGGATGQGCNSALQDAAALADILISKAVATDGPSITASVVSALRAYSKQRVPEGHALLDLSVGPGRDTSPIRRLLAVLQTVGSSLLFRFGIGDPPLQTELTTSLVPFVDVRRRRESLYGPFPSQAQFDSDIDKVEQSVP